MDPRQQLQELASRLASQEAVISTLQAQLLALSNTVSNTSVQPRPKPALPDPAKFDGKPYHYDTWLPSIKAKLRVDGAALGDSITQFYYVYDRLESTVQSIVLPQLARAEEDEVWSYQSILDQLSRAYDNPNKTQEAEERLHRIEQGTDSVPAYILRFERQLYEAKGHKWSDDRKIAAFRYGLSRIIKDRLATQLELPNKYSRFLRVVQQLSSRSAVTLPSTSTTHHARPSNTRPDQMDLSTFSIGAINMIDTPSSSSLRARSTSPAERERRRSLGTCVRCGSRGHWVRDCPLHAYKASTGRTVTIEAVNDDDDGRDTGSDGGSAGYTSEIERLERGLGIRE